MSVQVRAPGIEGFRRFLEAAPTRATTAARIALNSAAKDALKMTVPKAMLRQVAFPPDYLQDPTRLSIDRPATNNSLETSILGRDRPTSLARFATGLAAFGTKQTGDVLVMVKPGRPRALKKVFPIKLRQGDGSGGGFNVGLAVRLKPGETLESRTLGNAGVGLEFVPNVYLLYGPSVDQIFGDVADEVSPAIADAMETEFFRQYGLRDENGDIL